MRLRFTRALVSTLAFCALPLTAAAQAPTACVGDCNADASVTVDEIITLVNIALGVSAPSECVAGDADSSGTITVDEILTAVNRALEGCPAEPTPTPTPGEPTATPTATPTFGGPLGTRRFTFDSQRSNFTAVLAPGFEVSLGSFRGQNDGVLGDAFFEFEAGAPDAAGLAPVNITDASDYLVAQASIANFTICLKPIVPIVNAGIIQCNGGLDYSIFTSVDRVVGQVGEDGFTVADCTAVGGSIEGPNQVCGAGLVGLECFVNADCDSTNGTGDGVCGLSSGQCQGGFLGPNTPCETSADCDGVACEPVLCTAGKIGQACRNAGDCDTTPTAEDGTCGNSASNPGGCQGTLQLGQIGEDSGPGSLVIAPLEQFGLQGLPIQLSFENALPCGDEGSGPVQAFAVTSGTARTSIFHFNAGDDELVYEQKGQNFSCTDWRTGTGGRFGLAFPAIDANPVGGGDIIIGFTFQGR